MGQKNDTGNILLMETYFIAEIVYVLTGIVKQLYLLYLIENSTLTIKKKVFSRGNFLKQT